MSDTPRTKRAANLCEPWTLPTEHEAREKFRLFVGEMAKLERENEALRKDAELALAQAREEGRREGMREAAGIDVNALHPIIAGAIYDFAGFLTTRDSVIPVGASENASPIVDLLKEWANLRELQLNDAAVQSWQEHTRAAEGK